MKERALSFLQQSWEVFSEFHLLLFSSVLFLFLFGTLHILYLEGMELFQSQKNALVVDVFSQTDLEADGYLLLEEKLRSLDGIKEVVSISPEVSLSRLREEPDLEMDAQWLEQLRRQKKQFLPWSYTLYLTRWDEPFLKDLLEKIKGIEIGFPKKKAVLEVHVDQERWSLVYALYHYLSWVRTVLKSCLLLLFVFLFVVFFCWFRRAKKNEEPFLTFLKKRTSAGEFSLVSIMGSLVGAGSYFACLLVLSFSFFPEFSYWKKFSGDFLIFQLFLSIFIVLAAFLYRRISEK